MSKKGDLLYLGHMLDAARRAHTRAAAVTREEFEANEDLQIVLAHLIQIIGEAARHVPENARATYPQIPWEHITGMRHRIVHDYVRVRVDIVWQVATIDLPVLIDALESLTPPEPPSA